MSCTTVKNPKTLTEIWFNIAEGHFAYSRNQNSQHSLFTAFWLTRIKGPLLSALPLFSERVRLLPSELIFLPRAETGGDFGGVIRENKTLTGTPDSPPPTQNRRAAAATAGKHPRGLAGSGAAASAPWRAPAAGAEPSPSRSRGSASASSLRGLGRNPKPRLGFYPSSPRVVCRGRKAKRSRRGLCPLGRGKRSATAGVRPLCLARRRWLRRWARAWGHAAC